MSTLEAIYRSIQYLEAHIRAPLNVGDLADAAGYSLFHFSRCFNSLVGHSPYDYMIRRRLAEAAFALVHGERPIIDVALEYCFNSPETFSRAFRRVYGLAPREARKAGRVDPGRRMPRLTRAHVPWNGENPPDPPSKAGSGTYFSSLGQRRRCCPDDWCSPIRFECRRSSL